MKNTTKFFIGTFALAFIALASTSMASAYQGDPSVKGPDSTPERHEAMEAAFTANDYNAWTELMNNKGRVTQVITADNFAQFAEAHALAEAGDLEGSKNIRAELGLGLKDGSGNGQGQKANKRGSGNGNQTGLKDGSGARGNSANCTLNQ